MRGSVHVGFYDLESSPIGRFQVLLYVPDAASDDLVGAILRFFSELPDVLGSECGTLASGLLMWLEEGGVSGVKMVDRLNPNIVGFVHLGLETRRLELFAVQKTASESATEEVTENWSRSRHPETWSLVSESHLG